MVIFFVFQTIFYNPGKQEPKSDYRYEPDNPERESRNHSFKCRYQPAYSEDPQEYVPDYFHAENSEKISF